MYPCCKGYFTLYIKQNECLWGGCIELWMPNATGSLVHSHLMTSNTALLSDATGTTEICKLCFDVRSLMHVPVLDILRQQSSLKSNKVRIETAEQCWWSRSQVFQTGDHRFMSRLALCLFHCVITGWSVSFALASYFGFHLLLRFRKRLGGFGLKHSTTLTRTLKNSAGFSCD